MPASVSALLTREAGFDLESYLAQADSVILPSHLAVSALPIEPPEGELFTGVDLGTAYLVLVVLDSSGRPVAGEYQFAEVAKDGLVVDFIGAVDRLKEMKARVEKRIGRTLTHAASGYPPGVPQSEVRATANVLRAAGFECSGLLDEPTAANNLLRLHEGAIVDVGGGTTGVAVVQNGKVVATADEPCGGTHFSLVIAGSLDIPFEEAEKRKIDPSHQKSLFPAIKAVMEKVGSIVKRNIADFPVKSITLVGGSTAFPGMAEVVQEYTGIPTSVPTRPLFITPIGIALHDNI